MDHRPLESFVVDALSSDELRRLVARLPDGAALAAQLPSSGVSLAELVFQTVELLRRQGAIDAAFFAALASALPRRAAAVADLARAASVGASGAAATNTAPAAGPHITLAVGTIEGGRGAVLENGAQAQLTMRVDRLTGGEALRIKGRS